MQKADTQGHMGSSPMARSGPSPFVAFAVAAVLALAGLGVWFFAAQGEAPKPAPAPEIEGAPAEPLTEAEAIAEFERLNALGISVGEAQDENVVAQAFESGSELYKRSMRLVQDLKRDGVVDRTEFTTLRMEVVSVLADRFEVRETRRVEACFETVHGKDITDAPEEVEQVILWSVVETNLGWRLSSGALESEKTTNDRPGRC